MPGNHDPYLKNSYYATYYTNAAHCNKCIMHSNYSNDIIFNIVGKLEIIDGKQFLIQKFKKNLITKIAAVPSLPALKRLAKKMSYKEYGGALFLGVKKPVIKAHGSSDELVFYYTIKQAEEFVKGNSVQKMIAEVEKQKEKQSQENSEI